MYLYDIQWCNDISTCTVWYMYYITCTCTQVGARRELYTYMYMCICSYHGSEVISHTPFPSDGSAAAGEERPWETRHHRESQETAGGDEDCQPQNGHPDQGQGAKEVYTCIIVWMLAKCCMYMYMWVVKGKVSSPKPSLQTTTFSWRLYMYMTCVL